MKYFHQADSKLPKWLDDVASGKISKTASRNEDPIVVPYGTMERASQINSKVIEAMIKECVDSQPPHRGEDAGGLENIDAGEGETVEELEKIGQDADIDKQIENATSVEELEKIEAELNKHTEAAPVEEPAKEEQPSGNEASPATPPGTSPDVAQLKQEIEEVKKHLDSLDGEEKIKNDIADLKKKMDNIEILDDANFNDSIYQEASHKVAHAKRVLRRKQAKTITIDSSMKTRLDYDETDSEMTEFAKLWLNNEKDKPGAYEKFKAQVKQIEGKPGFVGSGKWIFEYKGKKYEVYGSASGRGFWGTDYSISKA